MARNSFSLNLKTAKAIRFIELEKDKAGKSKTSFINGILERLADWPITLASDTESPCIFDEIEAVRELLNDDLIKKIPHFAALTRRNRVQMLLHLIEKGIEADDQLELADVQKIYQLKAPKERSVRKTSNSENSLDGISAATA